MMVQQVVARVARSFAKHEQAILKLGTLWVLTNCAARCLPASQGPLRLRSVRPCRHLKSLQCSTSACAQSGMLPSTTCAVPKLLSCHVPSLKLC